jgi:predicted nucleic acid-binding protein
MSDAILDTTVFIDARNGLAPALDLLARLRALGVSLRYSPITVFELWLRPMLRDEEAAHLGLLATCTEAPFDSRAARIMASWLSGHPRSGRKRMLGDAMIAASAASLGAAIFTRNPRDFTRFYTDVQGY